MVKREIGTCVILCSNLNSDGRVNNNDRKYKKVF